MSTRLDPRVTKKVISILGSKDVPQKLSEEIKATLKGKRNKKMVSYRINSVLKRRLWLRRK